MALGSRVLIVEDDGGIRAALELAFEDSPFSTVIVDDAEDALLELESGPFAAIVCDKNLPGKSGTELLRQVRKGDQATVFMIITAYPSAENAFDSLGLGVDAYVLKPFDVYALVERVGQLVQQRQRQARQAELAGAKQAFQKATAALKALHSGDGPRAVVVSPDASERDWLLAQLTRFGLPQVAVETRDAAETAVRAGGVELVVIDDRLGWDEAVNLVTFIRAREPDTGLLVVADVRPELPVLTELINRGVASILQRPVDAARFSAAVVRILGEGARK